jgi:hypothetical protein
MTLIELLVAMTVAGIILGLIVMISVRQQRVIADVADATALGTQLRDAEAVLSIDLRAVSPSAGDIRAGEARDTSIEFRGVIASAVVCDTSRGRLILAPAATGSTTYASYLTTIQAGDTAWLLDASDSASDWLPHAVLSVASAVAGRCAAVAPALDSASSKVARVGIAIDSAPTSSAIGRPLRVTRPLRYSIYRGADGDWYLGQRDWNPGTARFNSIQPVSGPFLPPALGGMVFRYLDSAGRALSTPVGDTRSIALVQVDLRGQSKNSERAFGAAPPAAHHADSTSIVVRLHNRE